jgi:hypothetical protein
MRGIAIRSRTFPSRGYRQPSISTSHPAECMFRLRVVGSDSNITRLTGPLAEHDVAHVMVYLQIASMGTGVVDVHVADMERG